MPLAGENVGLQIGWAGEKLTLLPERALWWARQETLFVADIHLGKAGVFRKAGLPVPDTTHQCDLARLNRVLRATAAARLVILGDLQHAPGANDQSVIHALQDWRAQHPNLNVVLVPGNHDRGPMAPLENLSIHCRNAPWSLAPFVCLHEPEHWAEGFALCGHWHPACRLTDRTGTGLSAPCFYFGRHIAVLPAFGEFTGRRHIQRKHGDRVFVVNGGDVIEVPPA
ncbi:MAG TPA: ligase-associated DNA damage response endonuclease PdeM [Verrucomicrobiaceae bacterium]